MIGVGLWPFASMFLIFLMPSSKCQTKENKLSPWSFPLLWRLKLYIHLIKIFTFLHLCMLNLQFACKPVTNDQAGLWWTVGGWVVLRCWGTGMADYKLSKYSTWVCLIRRRVHGTTAEDPVSDLLTWQPGPAEKPKTCLVLSLSVWRVCHKESTKNVRWTVWSKHLWL